MHYSKEKSPSTLKIPENILSFIPKSMIPYLKRESTDEQIDPYLFEFFVYQKMYHQLDRGRLCCNDSVSYSDIDHDLVDESLVDNVEEIAMKFGYPKIPIYCDKRLDDAIEMLDCTWDKTTERIHLGENAGFNIKEIKAGQQEWSLLYDSSESLDDAFFKTLPKKEIADIIMYMVIVLVCGMALPTLRMLYQTKKPIALAVTACLLSEAFGFGTKKMAEMSDLIYCSYEQHAKTSFASIPCGVNDMVANFINLSYF